MNIYHKWILWFWRRLGKKGNSPPLSPQSHTAFQVKNCCITSIRAVVHTGYRFEGEAWERQSLMRQTAKSLAKILARGKGEKNNIVHSCHHHQIHIPISNMYASYPPNVMGSWIMKKFKVLLSKLRSLAKTMPLLCTQIPTLSRPWKVPRFLQHGVIHGIDLKKWNLPIKRNLQNTE